MTRAYTAAEIDRMRNVLGYRMTTGRCYNSETVHREIEDMLRTYIAASVEPDDLCAPIERVIAEWTAKWAARETRLPKITVEIVK